MGNEVMEKLIEHDHYFSTINEKLVEHDQQFFSVNKRLDQHAEQLDLLSMTVADHTERLERIEQNMVTKNDLRFSLKGISDTLDELVRLYTKKDQELAFMHIRISRVEDDVKQIKPLVGLAS